MALMALRRRVGLSASVATLRLMTMSWECTVSMLAALSTGAVAPITICTGGCYATVKQAARRG